MQFLASTSPPDAQCRFWLEVKQMPQWLVSSEVLSTHKVWGKVLFDHFQFCLILSDIRSKNFVELFEHSDLNKMQIKVT